MHKRRCLIVEDEPLAVEVLTDYVNQVPSMTVVASCNNALDAMNYLQNENIEVMFLDLHLPKIKGFDFLKTLQNPPKVIVTTAYHQYALEGYELNVVDYLLKPFEFSRFLMAVNKLHDIFAGLVTESYEKTSIEEKPLFFQVNKRNIKVLPSEIIYAESQKDYVDVNTIGEKLTLKMPFHEFEEKIPTSIFLRIHRSFIVNLQHLKSYTQSEIEVDGKSLPIGGNYKELVNKRFLELNK